MRTNQVTLLVSIGVLAISSTGFVDHGVVVESGPAPAVIVSGPPVAIAVATPALPGPCAGVKPPNKGGTEGDCMDTACQTKMECLQNANKENPPGKCIGDFISEAAECGKKGGGCEDSAKPGQCHMRAAQVTPPFRPPVVLGIPVPVPVPTSVPHQIQAPVFEQINHQFQGF